MRAISTYDYEYYNVGARYSVAYRTYAHVFKKIEVTAKFGENTRSSRLAIKNGFYSG